MAPELREAGVVAERLLRVDAVEPREDARFPKAVDKKDALDVRLELLVVVGEIARYHGKLRLAPDVLEGVVLLPAEGDLVGLFRREVGVLRVRGLACHELDRLLQLGVIVRFEKLAVLLAEHRRRRELLELNRHVDQRGEGRTFKEGSEFLRDRVRRSRQVDRAANLAEIDVRRGSQ